ncbi:hypothetical protein ACFVTY_31295 [Streptomyces sp. NPDC058067]|uniref:hypothetical protein n=1 Tax=Streptomyces sp. NPDC058067 TaxID=3346324 RepID=UPI0036E799F6
MNAMNARSGMPGIERHQIPGLFLRAVPEARAGIEAQAGRPAEAAVTRSADWFDLYDFLREVAYRGVIKPALLTPEAERDTELLSRCAQFTEELLVNSSETVASAAFFQLIEPLYASEDLLIAAIPLMLPQTLHATLEDLAVDRLSTQTQAALAPYLP